MLMSLSGVKQGMFRSACLQDCTGFLLSGVKHGTFRSACLQDCTGLLLSGVKHGTFCSACLQDCTGLLLSASTLCGHLLWRFAIQQQSTAPQSGHALLTQVGSMYS